MEYSSTVRRMKYSQMLYRFVRIHVVLALYYTIVWRLCEMVALGRRKYTIPKRARPPTLSGGQNVSSPYPLAACMTRLSRRRCFSVEVGLRSASNGEVNHQLREFRLRHTGPFAMGLPFHHAMICHDAFGPHSTTLGI